MLLTISEAAAILTVSVRTIERMVKAGDLAVIKIRRVRRIAVTEINAWLAKHGYNEDTVAPLPMSTTCQERKEDRTVTACTSNQDRTTGTQVIPMRKASAVEEVTISS